MVDYVEMGASMFSGSLSKLGGIKWLFIVVAVLALIGAIGWFAVKMKKKNQVWNLKVKIRQEDTRNEQIYIDPVVIKARRITLKNGSNMLLLEKTILGKRLMPLLNYYTKPGEYDLVLTADNRIFITTGIEGIDKQRKLLKVGIRYPGIDQDLDEVNQQFKELNKQDKFDKWADIIKYGAMSILAIAVVIVVIIGGKYLVDAKQMDVQLAQAESSVLEGLNENGKYNLEIANSMNLLIPKLEEMYGTRNLYRQINPGNSS